MKYYVYSLTFLFMLFITWGILMLGQVKEIKGIETLLVFVGYFWHVIKLWIGRSIK